MLISFSGCQSSGKTTLLKALEVKYPQWNYVPEVTRLVKRKYNLPINEDGNDLTQTMIMAEHLVNACTIYKNKDSHTVLDRCSLDGLVYTHWLYDKQSVKVNTYNTAVDICQKTIGMYDLIFYTNPYDVDVVDDGERSTNVQFRNEIIELFENYRYMCKDRIFTLDGTVENRLKQIEEIIAFKINENKI